MKKTVLMIVMLMLSAAISLAQSGSSWKTVESIPKEQRIVVETKAGKTIKGRFISADENKMSVMKSGNPVDVAASDVKRIFAGKKKRSILGGVLGGLGGMLLLGGLAASDDPENYNDMVLGGAGLFGGAILGGKLGAKTKKAWLIYEAP